MRLWAIAVCAMTVMLLVGCGGEASREDQAPAAPETAQGDTTETSAARDETTAATMETTMREDTTTEDMGVTPPPPKAFETVPEGGTVSPPTATPGYEVLDSAPSVLDGIEGSRIQEVQVSTDAATEAELRAVAWDLKPRYKGKLDAVDVIFTNAAGPRTGEAFVFLTGKGAEVVGDGPGDPSFYGLDGDGIEVRAGG